MTEFLSNLGGHFLRQYNKWDFYIYLVVTLLVLYFGQLTVFYLIYLFWWNELINLVVDRFFYKKNPNIKISKGDVPFLFTLLMVGFFGVLIVGGLGIFMAWSNPDVLVQNASVFLFKNYFFNFNIAFMAFQRIFIHLKKKQIEICIGEFSPEMIMVFISTLIGLGLILVAVNKFPDFFNPTNRFGSLLLALPFLLLKWRQHLKNELKNRKELEEIKIE